MKKQFLGMITAAVLAAASVPAYTASAADQQETKRFADGSYYTYWNADYAGSLDVQEQPEGGVTMKWDRVKDCLVRYGSKLESSRTVPELGSIAFQYDAEIKGTGSYFVRACAYSANPRREYYVVEGWQGWRPSGSKELLTTEEINGVKYDIYRTKWEDFSDLDRTVYPIYWSVRQENQCTEGEKNHLTGTIQMDAHFRVWDRFDKGVTMETKITDFFVEADAFSGDETDASGSCTLAKPGIALTSSAFTEDPLRSHQNWDYSYPVNGNGMQSFLGPYFRIGGSISAFQTKNASLRAFYKEHFNSVTCEFDMTPQQIIREIDGTNVTVDLEKADAVLKFAEENGIGVRGRTFVWYSQTPNEMFQGTPEESDQRIENFIRETFSKLKSDYPDLKLYAYDVCTEVLKSEGGGLRGWNGNPADNSQWAKVYGEDNDAYIINAFRAARAYAPEDCKLFLNENNEYLPEKCEDICKLAKKIMKEGNYIDGIGMESHLDARYPDKDTYENAFKKFAALGLDIQITELDITNAHGSEPEKQQKLWKDVFRIAMTNSDRITGITLWEPLSYAEETYKSLFDRNMQPKDTYYDIIYKHFDDEGTTTAPVTTTAKVSTTAVYPDGTRGDANCDGAVDVADAVLVLRYVSEDETANITDQGVQNGDADRNGRTDDKDASVILQYIAKKITF